MSDLAARHRLPAIYADRESVELGGLMSYRVDLGDVTRRLAGMTAEVLKGAKPADMPFQRPARFELVPNRQVAAGLGLGLPSRLLISADAVLE